MLELTMIMLGAATLFFILHLIFKSDEMNAMSTIMCILGLAAVLKDTDMGDNLIFFVLPLFYGVITSALSLIPGWRNSHE